MTTPTGDQERDRLIEQLDASLRAQPGLDASEREAMLRHFGDSLATATTDTPVDADGKAGPDRRALRDTLDGLVGEGVLSKEDQAELDRQFERALEGLNSADLQSALEFSRRVERDGADEARRWRSETARAAPEAGAQTPVEGAGVPPHLAASLRPRRRR